MGAPKKTNPRGGNRRVSEVCRPSEEQPCQSSRGRWVPLPANWRDRLPRPSAYYAAHVDLLGSDDDSGWAYAHCPFHDSASASLSVHLDGSRGVWQCHAGCGSGDLVAFHMRLKALPFRNAVAELLRWRL
jgi:hypothetical protein